ncbi:MAG: hypothetical protein AAFV45_04410 [Pseudomonadota bacterium]
MFRTIAVVSLVCCGLAVKADASDYQHSCTTADARFEIQDETLFVRSDPNQRAIPYQVLDKTMVSERRGYCVAGGKNYGFEAQTYTLRIRFDYQGATLETMAQCDLASDGLPASVNCEREVTTFLSGGGEAVATGPTMWNHNGSVMRLEAEGNLRRFVYDRPRAGMVKAGARSGDVVFEGQRTGATYSGTAYIFSRSCGQVPYPVAGNVSADQRAVVLEGQAPRLGANCQVKSYRRDRLSFELMGR